MFKLPSYNFVSFIKKLGTHNLASNTKGCNSWQTKFQISAAACSSNNLAFIKSWEHNLTSNTKGCSVIDRPNFSLFINQYSMKPIKYWHRGFLIMQKTYHVMIRYTQPNAALNGKLEYDGIYIVLRECKKKKKSLVVIWRTKYPAQETTKYPK